jgi:hypothetical protein
MFSRIDFLRIGGKSIHRTPQTTVPSVQRYQKKFKSRLVVPTFFRKKPFGKNVEALSYLLDESCAVEVSVQTDDFEN